MLSAFEVAFCMPPRVAELSASAVAQQRRQPMEGHRRYGKTTPTGYTALSELISACNGSEAPLTWRYSRHQDS
jgi:hypothetical protein